MSDREILGLRVSLASREEQEGYISPRDVPISDNLDEITSTSSPAKSRRVSFSKETNLQEGGETNRDNSSNKSSATTLSRNSSEASSASTVPLESYIPLTETRETVTLDHEHSKAHARKSRVSLPPFTESEVACLFSGRIKGTENYATEMVERAVKRQCNLKVDLKVQGPARNAVGRVEVEPDRSHSHSVLTLSNNLLRKKNTVTGYDHSDSLRTAQDVNMPVKSHNYGTTRPRTSYLDRVRLKSNTDISEVTFLSQLKVLQILQHWGTDVSDLIVWMQEAWGISFIRDLLDLVAVAAIADLRSYLASGGRPSPRMYVSTNISSNIQVIGKPSVSQGLMGTENYFFSRHREIACLTYLITLMILGFDCSQQIMFSCNGKYAATFRMSRFRDFKVTIKPGMAVPSWKDFVSNAGHLDEFLASRNCAKYMTVVKMKAVSEDITKIKNILTLCSGSSLASAMAKGAVFGGGRVLNAPSSHRYIDSQPRKVTAILFSAFHVPAEKLAEQVYYIDDMCGHFVFIACTPDIYTTFNGVYNEIEKRRSMHYLFSCVQTSTLPLHMEGFSIASASSSEPRRFGLLYVMIRHMLHAANQYKAALRDLALMQRGIMLDDDTCNLFKGDRSVAVVGPFFNSYWALFHILAARYHEEPFNRRKTANRTSKEQISNTTTLFAKYNFAIAMAPTTKRIEHYPFSALRVRWAKTYQECIDRLSIMLQIHNVGSLTIRFAYAVTEFRKPTEEELDVDYTPEFYETVRENLRAGVLLNMIKEHAKKMAYQYSKITFSASPESIREAIERGGRRIEGILGVGQIDTEGRCHMIVNSNWLDAYDLWRLILRSSQYKFVYDSLRVVPMRESEAEDVKTEKRKFFENIMSRYNIEAPAGIDVRASLEAVWSTHLQVSQRSLEKAAKSQLELDHAFLNHNRRSEFVGTVENRALRRNLRDVVVTQPAPERTVTPALFGKINSVVPTVHMNPVAKHALDMVSLMEDSAGKMKAVCEEHADIIGQIIREIRVRQSIIPEVKEEITKICNWRKTLTAHPEMYQFAKEAHKITLNKVISAYNITIGEKSVFR